MEKRLFLAILLSVFVLFAYTGIVAHFSPQQQSESLITPEVSSPVGTRFPTGSNQDIPPLIENMPEKIIDEESPITFNNNELQIKISKNGLGIKEGFIYQYNKAIIQNNIGGLVDFSGIKLEEKSTTDCHVLSYESKENDLLINQRFCFQKEKYVIELDIDFINTSDKTSYTDYALNIASIDQSLMKRGSMDQRYLELSISFADRTIRKPYASFTSPVLGDKLRWIGVRDQYFCSIIIPFQEIERIEKKKDESVISYIAHSKKLAIGPRGFISHKFLIYIGPQSPALIKQLGPGVESIIHYGFFDTVSQMLLHTLRFIFHYCKNWGVTLIIFSFLAFVIMSPLSIKSFSSMRKMQELQPEIEALKIKFKDAPQKLNREIMTLYKEKKINPFGGCLPLVLQMPIFIALFQLLSRFVDLKGAGFLWIKDLSEPDRFFVFSKSIPVIGTELNLLPIIMIIIMLAQQKITGAQQAKGEAAQQQKMMSLFMAVFFGVIFYRMPSGLVLYWSVNSLLMFLFQMRLFLKAKKA